MPRSFDIRFPSKPEDVFLLSPLLFLRSSANLKHEAASRKTTEINVSQNPGPLLTSYPCAPFNNCLISANKAISQRNARKAKKAATKVRIVPAVLKDVSGKMESTVAMKVTIAANWNEKGKGSF